MLTNSSSDDQPIVQQGQDDSDDAPIRYQEAKATYY